MDKATHKSCPWSGHVTVIRYVTEVVLWTTGYTCTPSPVAAQSVQFRTHSEHQYIKLKHSYIRRICHWAAIRQRTRSLSCPILLQSNHRSHHIGRRRTDANLIWNTVLRLPNIFSTISYGRLDKKFSISRNKEEKCLVFHSTTDRKGLWSKCKLE